MKKTLRYIAGLIVAASVVFAFGVPAVRAQSPCRTFEGIGQMLIPTTTPLETGHRWGGDVYLKMGDEYLQGLISGEDGTVVRQPNLGHGTDGLYIIGFGCVPGTPHWTCTDTIRIAVPNSIFGPTAPIFDQYQGNSAYFDGGTGRFQYASGGLTFGGPYIVWNTGGTPPRTGRFNPELKGHICGVE
jgi:hypothetical protein